MSPVKNIEAQFFRKRIAPVRPFSSDEAVNTRRGYFYHFAACTTCNDANFRDDLGAAGARMNCSTQVIECNVKDTLARVYVGRDPGRRVCEGMISVGAVVSLEAAIWFSDLRGFTAISENLSAEELVEGLNSYFEVVVGSIYAHGGEVLKYIGDAILAVFPVASFANGKAACEAALTAARYSTAQLVGLNERRSVQGAPDFAHGIGLHLGTAQYGNVGSKERLDFTVIGREVNLASRIEGLCKEAGEEILCSAAFASCCVATRPVGSFRLKGFAEPVMIHTV